MITQLQLTEKHYHGGGVGGGVGIAAGYWGHLKMTPEEDIGLIGLECKWVEDSGRRWELDRQNKLKFPV